ncbi:MAG: hypothetical protein KF745_02895 [Phycisphaeraceae bacterium]|nr:hypothetical protein [Phycisphaeraceae bacterium]
MSQFGMQMPGGQLQRRASMNVYTGLLFASTIALAAACVFVFIQASKVGKDGSAFALQDGKQISLPKK